MSGNVLLVQDSSSFVFYLDGAARAEVDTYSLSTITLLSSIASVTISYGLVVQSVSFGCVCSIPATGQRQFSFDSGAAGGIFSVDAGGLCNSPIVTKSGSGYSSIPSIVLPADCGVALNVSILMGRDGSGVGCSLPQGVLIFSGGGGYGATGIYSSTNGAISSITLLSRGYMYTAAPLVTVSDPTCQLVDLNASLTLPSNAWDTQTRQILANPSRRQISVHSAYGIIPSSGTGYRIDPPYLFVPLGSMVLQSGLL